MKKPILSLILITFLSTSFNLSWSQPDRSTFLTQLDALDARIARVTSNDLADYSEGLYNRIEAQNTKLKNAYERGEIDQALLSSVTRSMDSLERSAALARTHLSDVYRLRNTVNQLDFVRANSPELYYKAEREYTEALKMADQGRGDGLRISARNLKTQYQTLIRSGLQEVKRKRTPVLRKYQANLNADLQALNSSLANAEQVQQANGVVYRLSLGNSAWNNSSLGGLIGDIEPPYVPPLPPKPGPNPPSVGIDMITDTSLRFSFTDVSDNEDGNRIRRSTDLLNFPILIETGPVAKFSTHSHTDNNLQPSTQYCYEVETYNAEGARKSQMRCAFTNDGNNIGVWRLQLRIRVANIDDAGTDNPLRVIIHNNGSFLSTETILDYGRDDFEKNSDFTYDLNFDNIKELSSITGFQIINYSSEEDYLYIRELSLMVNGHEVFGRVFGNSSNSVLKLGYFGSFAVDHAELRNHPSWQSFLASSLSNPTFNLPPVTISDNGQFQAEISNKEIASRIEALMGTLMHTDLKGQFQWGHISGDAVEVSQKSTNAVHIDLDLEALIDWSPNPSLDIDFDTKITKQCDSSDPQKMTIKLESENFTTDADFQWWKDVLTLGITKGIADVIDFYAENCQTAPKIERSFDVFLPPDMTCSQLDVRVDAEGNLEVCCFSLNN